MAKATVTKGKGTIVPPTKEQRDRSTALVERKGGAVVAQDLAEEMAADSGRGMEKVDADSVAIPFIAILQSNSPACDPDDGEYISEAKPGMLMNTVTREVFDGKEGVLFVPCHYQRKMLKWVPRKAGGGFKGELMVEEVVRLREAGEIVEQDNRLYIADDHGEIDPDVSVLVSDTRVHYILLLNPTTGVVQQAVLSLASTQIKKSKQLIALLGNVLIERADGSKVNPSTFANVVRLTTVPESNEKGKWSGAKLELEGMVTDPLLYAKAKDFHRIISAGKVAVNYEAAAAAGVGGEGSAASEEAESFARGEPPEGGNGGSRPGKATPGKGSAAGGKGAGGRPGRF